MKIKVETMETRVEEKEIELPYFFKTKFISGDWHYAVFDEKTAMCVKPGELQTFGFVDAVAQFIPASDSIQTTEEEFTTAFEQTMERIQSMLPVTK